MSCEELADLDRRCELVFKSLTASAHEIYCTPARASGKSFETRHDTRPRKVRTQTVHDGTRYTLEWSVRLVEVS